MYEGDLDDDNDGLKDTLEESIGTNPKNENDAVIAIIQGTTYFLIDTNSDDIFDYLYNPSNSIKSNILEKNDYFYLDINNDNNWDYIYSNGYYEVYVYPFEVPWVYILIGVIIAIILTIFFLFKKGIIFLYQEEVTVEEK